MKRSSGTRGFSVVMTLTAMAVVSLVTLSIMQMMSDMSRVDYVVRRHEAATRYQMELLDLLKNSTSCEATFKNVTSVGTTTIPQILSAGGTAPVVFATSGDIIQRGLLRLDKVTLQGFTPNSSVGNDSSRGTMTLKVDFGSTDGAAEIGYSRLLLMAVELNAYVPPSPGVAGAGPADQINTCWAIGSTTFDAWKLAVTGDIFYSGGNVGIGMDTPLAIMSVNGAVLATDYLHPSDRELKTNIEEAKGLELIRQLQGRKFVWRSTGAGAYGVIAQEMKPQLPEAVTQLSNGDWAVEFSQIIGPLIEAIHELKLKNERLEQEISFQEKLLD